MGVHPSFVNTVLDEYLTTVAPTFKAMLVDPTYEAPLLAEVDTVTAATHEIAGVARVTLTTVTLVVAEDGCRLLCDDLSFAGLDGTTDVGGVVIFVDGGSDAANRIVAWDLDDGPFTPPAGPLNYLVDDTDGFAVFTV